MENRKQAEWTEQVDALDSLPGEPVFNKDMAWDDLQLRLQQEPRRRVGAWFWAAACLFSLLLASWFFFHSDGGEPAKTVSRKDSRSPITAIKLSLVLKPAIPVTASAVTERKNNIAQNKSVAPQQALVTAIPVKDLTLPVAGNEPTPLPDLQTVHSIDTMSIAGAIPSAKKKLRVIHVNELDKIPEQVAASTGRDQKTFIIRLGTVHTVNTTPAGSQAYAGGFKIPFTN